MAGMPHVRSVMRLLSKNPLPDLMTSSITSDRTNTNAKLLEEASMIAFPSRDDQRKILFQ